MTAVDDRHLWVAPEPEPEPERRTAPPDRRAPTAVAEGGCPLGSSCRCCDRSTKHRQDNRHRCPLPHPNSARDCQLPYPKDIAPCQERDTLPQAAPGLHQACCVECGRVTARRWTDPQSRTLAWCAGTMPEPAERIAQ